MDNDRPTKLNTSKPSTLRRCTRSRLVSGRETESRKRLRVLACLPLQIAPFVCPCLHHTLAYIHITKCIGLAVLDLFLSRHFLSLALIPVFSYTTFTGQGSSRLFLSVSTSSKQKLTSMKVCVKLNSKKDCCISDGS